MKRLLVPLASLLIPLAFLFAQESAELKEFKPKDGMFKVLLPGKPKELETMLIGKKVKNYGVVVGFDGSYAINVTPSPFAAKATPEEIAKHLEETVKSLNFTIADSKKITQGKILGHEVKGDSKDKKDLSVKYRAFVVKDHLVQILVRGQAKFVTGVQAKKVFDSFTLEP